ncbi:Dps family protein [Helicobacter mustelae]|uniref:Possible bacterioferritin/homolog of H. pylori NapA n=1 Tax=Helicobacter mustelae (strain ATCC 43772 / CCUG 25715 / CIP 103759 / LMG 18044 / NCTC 12198 / R85-136P) TaxID=679897 RepID=D3UJ48_HELM1|nr:DNA starvation/stationary phase protection protein [Helicobacter mustelae]CBG40523.1 possible bacterioferritin/homolog of H. pylori NapA [Helicobacter mustelae 12198]SQH72021.1 NapA-like bacterioferritin [Helicobacter mustelae]STP13164.1 NapA-like bacterioferritin [Helicobacter mustelae]
MKRTIELLKQLQADSLVLFMKVHNFHWHVRGTDFHHVHKATEEIYERFADMFDDLAERMIQLGEKPIVTVSEALKISKIKEETKTSFVSREVFHEIIKDYEYLLEHFKKLSELADEIKDKPTENYADDEVAYLQKAIWMLKASQA